ncbi:MAG TPA: type II toxin-antitoxin system HicB family antitoxin [Thermoleophilaceae bacterium]|nr:type II toxin-antitoxin system HicB family antitoxin [Thermoleophilaceae bacterium]
MPRYPIVIEHGPNSYSAYAPDAPGCVAAGATRDDVTKRMTEALKLHFEALRADGQSIPEPGISDTYVEI